MGGMCVCNGMPRVGGLAGWHPPGRRAGGCPQRRAGGSSRATEFPASAEGVDQGVGVSTPTCPKSPPPQGTLLFLSVPRAPTWATQHQVPPLEPIPCGTFPLVTTDG